MFVIGLHAPGPALFEYFTGHLVWYVAIFGSFTSTVFLSMAALAAIRYSRRSRAWRAYAGSIPFADFPAVSILKPVHGMEARLEETLESFFRQDYPDFEIIFGARNDTDESLAVIAKLRARYPQVKTRVVISGAPSWPNAKVFSLAKMMAMSDNEFLVISDSDIGVEPDFLRNVVPPLLKPKVGLVTCLYQGVPARGLWSRLDGLGMSVEMPSGVMVADMMEGMKFALGAAIAVRRDAIEAMGGMSETAQFCADDFVLGNRIAAAGYEVVLSHCIVQHVLAGRSLRRTLGDQLRWMRSTRFSRPWGHVGAGLTYAVPFGVLAFLLGLGDARHPYLGAALLAAAWVNRMLLAAMVGFRVIGDRRCLRLMWLYPLRDLVGFCTWMFSFTGNKFLWRGEPYELHDEGRITPMGRSIEFVRDQVTQAHD
jgi:ceramide glucosyltransferase